jgi:hypothetical protein
MMDKVSRQSWLRAGQGDENNGQMVKPCLREDAAASLRPSRGLLHAPKSSNVLRREQTAAIASSGKVAHGQDRTDGRSG